MFGKNEYTIKQIMLDVDNIDARIDILQETRSMIFGSKTTTYEDIDRKIQELQDEKQKILQSNLMLLYEKANAEIERKERERYREVISNNCTIDLDEKTKTIRKSDEDKLGDALITIMIILLGMAAIATLFKIVS